jgi:hypothetical protein
MVKQSADAHSEGLLHKIDGVKNIANRKHCSLIFQFIRVLWNTATAFTDQNFMSDATPFDLYTMLETMLCFLTRKTTIFLCNCPVDFDWQGDQGSMLWSQFSAIFDNFRQKMAFFSKTNVMYDQNFALFSFVLSKNCQFFADYLAKIFKKS